MNHLETKIPPPLLMAALGVAMWLTSRFISAPAWVSDWLPQPWRYPMSIGLWLIAATLFAGALLAFSRAQTTVNPHHPDKATALINSGVFRLSRNPLYLAMLLILIGWAFWLGNLIALAITSGFFIYMNPMQILPEERALQSKFGEEFTEYKTRVRRWL